MPKTRLTDRTELVAICHGSDCRKEGAKEIYKTVKRCTRKAGLGKKRLIVKTKCTGHCKQAPIVVVQPSDVWIEEATEEAVLAALEGGES